MQLIINSNVGINQAFSQSYSINVDTDRQYSGVQDHMSNVKNRILQYFVILCILVTAL